MLTVEDQPVRVLIVMNTSYKSEVLVNGQWNTNSLRFATYDKAFASVRKLMSKWYLTEDGRAVESTDMVNYRFDFDNNCNVGL